MPQVIRCPQPGCQQAMSVPDTAVGQRVMCPKCKKPFTVPGGGPPPQPVGAGVGGGPGRGGPGGVQVAPSPKAAPAPSPGPSAGGTPKVCPQCGSQLLEGAESCDIGIFGDNQIEKLHAAIVMAGNRYFLEDAATPGGTYVNDQRVMGRVPLNSGDMIRVGNHVLCFRERQKRSDGQPQAVAS